MILSENNFELVFEWPVINIHLRFLPKKNLTVKIFCRYVDLTVSDFEIVRPTIVRGCGALECDSNHCDNDLTNCISYGGPDSHSHRWALSGKILLKGKHKDIPFIDFQSSKMAGLFCKGLNNMKPPDPFNPVLLRAAVKAVLSKYEEEGIKWDLVLWGKFSMKG